MTQEQLNEVQVELSNIQKKFEEVTRKLEEKINVLESKMTSFEGNDGLFTWKIGSFSELLRKAESGEQTDLYSSPFYRYGYKCKLNSNPNGYGDGENTHLSIFIIVMKGEYDATLTWPFNKNVTFTLIDQQEDANERENIGYCLKAKPSSTSYARPVEDENVARGSPKFVSHEKLQERRYIVDDTIFIQVQIASP